MANDLVVVEKIEKRLREPREPIIFPLAANHRKELRKLRDDNVGQLTDQIRNIKKLKSEEYIKKYSKEQEKRLVQKEKDCAKLNKDWKTRIVKIQTLLQERKELEEGRDTNHLKIKIDYGDICNLNRLGNTKREFSIDKIEVSKTIAEEDFDIKYGETFVSVQKKIDDIVTKYEEAINFGDLEIVKELYYIMKTSDKLFKKISELKV